MRCFPRSRGQRLREVWCAPLVHLRALSRRKPPHLQPLLQVRPSPQPVYHRMDRLAALFPKPRQANADDNLGRAHWVAGSRSFPAHTGQWRRASQTHAVRRFSQRNSLVTLSEINITPLLDLAFVLLIIFVITTPMLEGSLNMNLPGQSARPDQARPPKAEDIRTVEIDRAGNYRLQKRPLTLDQIEAQLAADFKGNPNLIVRVRVDKDAKSDYPMQLLDRCTRRGVTQVSFSTELR
ncbi:MAG: biopolymer transporter ExbD [Proteobacteria bacterium]|nr:biopolymer transporter ExbD [Verrucomicrobiota bacterium]NBU11469.1 biopolymer transporter ExbD [Pseudomonadota bacterium]